MKDSTAMILTTLALTLALTAGCNSGDEPSVDADDGRGTPLAAASASQTPPARPLPPPTIGKSSDSRRPSNPKAASRSVVDQADGFAFLQKYCHECHGVRDESGTGLSVLDRSLLVAEPNGAKPRYVSPGKPEASLLWIKAVKNKSMPDDYAVAGQHPVPSDPERAAFEAWIKAGALFPATASQRQFVDEAIVLKTVLKHLVDIPAPERPFWRYLSLVSLHNNRDECSNRQLRLTRAAASKLLNSLSWEEKIAVPPAIDIDGLILAIDLRKYGWSPGSHWRIVERANPYGVRFSEQEALLRLQDQVKEMTKSSAGIVRADWFIATMSRAPFYDQLLGLPGTLQELEDRLKVEATKNFENNVAQRAGLLQSQVSRNNRMLERHPTPFGAYWRSYDFASNDQRGNLLRFPLGPRYPSSDFDDHAFEHAGGEIIFHLPNQLIGYMLADAKDKRLDGPAPISIVRDLREASGTPEIVNGLSCIACHVAGIRRFRDQVRRFPAVFGPAKLKVDRVYRTPKQFEPAIAEDESRFRAALVAACGDFLRVAEDRERHIGDFEEPIAAVARFFQRDLTPAVVAAEVGLDGVPRLNEILRSSSRMRELGLGPLLDSGGIKRALWERAGVSLFDFLNIELNRTPIDEF